MELPASGAGKAEWRSWARGARSELEYEALSGSVVARLMSWPRLSDASLVLLFLPLADEIDLRPLLEAGLDCRFAATRTPDHGGTLSVHELGGPLEVHRLGFLQPHESSPRIDPGELDVLLLPGLAFDLWGTRLGRGAGYFDRLLMQVTLTAALIGVTPADLVVDRLPAEAHDVPVAYLATEEGVIEVAT